MKNILRVGLILGMGILLAESVGASGPDHHVPLTAEDQGVDIPQIGSSVFDKIFSEPTPNGARYDVPYPLQSLLARVQSSEGAFVHSLFPFSRSLQRPVDLRYDPLLNPRLVLGSSAGALTRNKLFIGYVKATDQLEVISYNDEAGRYEYQLVRDYSQNPKVFYVNRGKCLSCHQGQSPIFSTPPWADSSIGAIGDLIGAKLGLAEGPRSDPQLLFSMLFDANLSRSNVAMLDSLVRESNQISMDERVWVVGCGQSRACRLGLLLWTLAPNSEYTKTFFAVADATIRHSPLKDQDQFHSFLTSFDMGARAVMRRYSRPDLSGVEAVAQSPEALMEIVNNIHRLEGEDNPATKRPIHLKTAGIRFGRLASFTLEDYNAIDEAGLSAGTIGKILLKFYDDGSPIFAQASINKPFIMRELFAAVGSPLSSRYGQWLAKVTPTKVLLTEPVRPVFQRAELNLFSRHCSACHASGLRFPPQFLLGSEDQVTRQISGLRDRIRFKLENNLMPPNPDARRVLVETGDKEILLKYLAETEAHTTL